MGHLGGHPGSGLPLPLPSCGPWEFMENLGAQSPNVKVEVLDLDILCILT